MRYSGTTWQDVMLRITLFLGLKQLSTYTHVSTVTQMTNGQLW